MPITKHIDFEGGKIVIWEINESINELESLLKNRPSELEESSKYAHPKKKEEFFASRCLLNDLNLLDIFYKTEDGKPHLSDGKHISISHDHPFITCMIATSPCGIDIQKTSERIDRIKEKFLNEKELIYTDNLDDLMKIWCAKEALYKVNGKKEIFFKEHMIISDITENEMKGEITHNFFNGMFKINLLKFGKYYLAYTSKP